MLRLIALSAVVCLTAADSDAVRNALQAVVTTQSKKYNMGVSMAYISGADPTAPPVTVSAGYSDAGLGMGTPTRKSLPDDVYVWGSTTKMFTGPAVLQLVDQGKVSLDDAAETHVDPALKALNGTTMRDHWGEEVKDVTVRHLLHMTAGLHDYDSSNYTDDQFAERARVIDPVEVLGYSEPGLRSVPGTSQSYCSTNYVLLGLVLATHYHEDGQPWSWQAVDQMRVVPAALRQRGGFNRSAFANAGPCSAYTPVHEFMEHYEGTTLPSQDVSDISCAGGWTAGNYVGPVADVARYTLALYAGKPTPVLSAATRAQLSNFTAPKSPWSHHSFKFYGMGTFSLDWAAGDAEAYGHVGDTYGAQSQTTYFPSEDFVITVATNVETSSQAQPADATCTAFHAVRAALAGKAPPTCTFTVPRHFIGTCNCTYP